MVNKNTLYSELKSSSINEASCEMSLELSFSQYESDMTEVQYTIYRTWTAVATWEDHSIKEKIKVELTNSTFEFKEDIGGEAGWSEDWDRLKSIINGLIPSGPREFYFLDGEHIADLFKFSNLDQTKKLALLNSEIPQISVLIKIMEKLKNRYRLRKNRAIKTDEKDKSKAKGLTDKIEASQNSSENLQLKIEQKKNLIQKYTVDLQNVRTSIKKSTISKDQFDKYEGLKSNIKTMENQLIQNRQKTSDLLKKSAPFLCLETEPFQNVKEILNQIESEKIIPAPIPSDIIELISKREQCICGRDLNDAEIDFLRANMKTSIEQNLDGLLKRFRTRINQYIKKIPSWNKKLTDLRTKIIDLNKEILKSKNELETIATPGIDKEALNELFHKDDSLGDMIVRLEGEMNDFQETINDNNDTIESAEKELEDLKGRDSTEHTLNKNKEEFVIELISDFINIIENIEVEIIKIAEENTSKTFKNLISNPENWEGVKIYPNWEIIPVKKGGIYHEKVSAGETQVMGISFMSSLSSIVKHIIPFVFDSPFGKISVKSAETIGSTIPNLLLNQQMILFLTDTEHNNIFNSIKNNISQAYLLTMNEESIAEINPKTITEIEQFGEV